MLANMAEQVIDPAKTILTAKDREIIEQGHRQTYAYPDDEIEKMLLSYEEFPPRQPDGDLRDTNLLPYKPLTYSDLVTFRQYCGPISGINDNHSYSPKIGTILLQVADAYLRQICLFVNSHSPTRNLRDDYPTMAYLPHDFWNPPTDPPEEAYIEDRATFIRTKARLPPQRLRALTHLFIHLTPYPNNLTIKPHSALMIITPRAATIEYFDQLDHPNKHYLIGDLMSVISRVDPDRTSTWLELADWKCRAGASKDIAVTDRPEEKRRTSQVAVCTDALAQAFGHDINMFSPIGPGETTGFLNTYDFMMYRKATIIFKDLWRGYFSNVIDDVQYKPRVKRIFGHRPYKEGENSEHIDDPRQRRGDPPWVHFSEMVYRRLLPRELAQWNASNIWRGLNEEELQEKARMRMRDHTRAGRYNDMPKGSELGEFGKAMERKRERKLRQWLEDADCDGGKRVDRYHSKDDSVGWEVFVPK